MPRGQRRLPVADAGRCIVLATIEVRYEKGRVSVHYEEGDTAMAPAGWRDHGRSGDADAASSDWWRQGWWQQEQQQQQQQQPQQWHREPKRGQIGGKRSKRPARDSSSSSCSGEDDGHRWWHQQEHWRQDWRGGCWEEDSATVWQKLAEGLGILGGGETGGEDVLGGGSPVAILRQGPRHGLVNDVSVKETVRHVEGGGSPVAILRHGPRHGSATDVSVKETVRALGKANKGPQEEQECIRVHAGEWDDGGPEPSSESGESGGGGVWIRGSDVEVVPVAELPACGIW